MQFSWKTEECWVMSIYVDLCGGMLIEFNDTRGFRGTRIPSCSLFNRCSIHRTDPFAATCLRPANLIEVVLGNRGKLFWLLVVAWTVSNISKAMHRISLTREHKCCSIFVWQENVYTTYVSRLSEVPTKQTIDNFR